MQKMRDKLKKMHIIVGYEGGFMQKFKLYLKIILIVTFYLISGYFLLSINKLNILNTEFLLITYLINICLLLLITYKLISKSTSKISKRCFTLLTIIFSILFVLGSIFLNATRNFLIAITSKAGYEYITYNVVTLKNRNYKTIESLNSKNIGALKDEYNDLTKNISITYNLKEFDSINLLIESLENKDNDAIILNENYLDILNESDIDTYKEFKVLYSYSILVKSKIVSKQKIDVKEPFILYISGSDSRTGIKTTARSDVNILAVINPLEYKILLVSIPRDYYVQLHGTTGLKDKLTHAGIFGIDMSINTIEDLLDINIDHYLKVSFDTVISAVDIIDGIDIYSDLAFNSGSNCQFIKGVQHVNGACALAFSRTRKVYAGGDRHRGENQEQVITKILEKVNNKKYLTKYSEILKILEDSFETSLSYNEITSFVKMQMKTMQSWSVETYNLDGANGFEKTYTAGAYRYVMIPYEDMLKTAKQKINAYLK